MSRWQIDWKGDDLKRKLRGAEMRGIDDTMAAGAITFKGSHPGWHNRTGTAEGSVRTIEQSHEDSRGAVGRWGSTGVVYFIFLEILRGAALRAAATVEYPRLLERIKQQFARSF